MAARDSERGSATVEQAALAALIAVLLIAAVSAIAAGGEADAGRQLAAALGRRLTCAPRLPDACHHHPLVPAYGWPQARLVRALAPPPQAVAAPSGLPLMPVDFRRCRSESCAVAAGPHLTASGRRTTAFTEVNDRRDSNGWIEITYWLYRPTLGWERVSRQATQADVEAAAGVKVLERDDPALVPLETLPGRNHYDFPASERPPWQWHVTGRYPGWSS
ncbi:MAG: hypothetical protein ACTHKT_13605 [Solirubrobacterales bacterium]